MTTTPTVVKITTSFRVHATDCDGSDLLLSTGETRYTQNRPLPKIGETIPQWEKRIGR